MRSRASSAISLLVSAALAAGIAAVGIAPVQAYSLKDVARGLCTVQTLSNASPAPALSVGPEVGWNLGLTGMVPPAAEYYRLWDMNVAWKDINPAPGVFRFDELDRRIALVNSWGGQPVLVLGLTPSWASTNPSAGNSIWGPGSAYPPANMDTWRQYVQALVDRYGGRIAAYEIWNEANLETFWQGTPQQMAEMTSIAASVIGDSARVLAPSLTIRLASGGRFIKPFVDALTVGPEAIDAWALHTYPAGGAGPGVEGAAQARRDDIVRWQTALVEAVGPDSAWLTREIWDTEVDYGLAGPGSSPKTDFSDADGATLLQMTYRDSLALGIDQTFWYEFTAAPFDLLGVQFTPNTPLTFKAWNELAPQLTSHLTQLAAQEKCADRVARTIPEPTITPQGKRVSVNGKPGVSVSVVTTGLKPGSSLVPYVRVGKKKVFVAQPAIVINGNGRATWTLATSRKVTVYFTYEPSTLSSKRIAIP